MRRTIAVAAAASVAFGGAALARHPAPAVEHQQEEQKPGVVENLSGAVGGVLAGAAAAPSGPVASAAAATVGNKAGSSIGRFFKRLFGGGDDKEEKAAEAPVQAVSAEQAAQPASAQVPAFAPAAPPPVRRLDIRPAPIQIPPLRPAPDPIGDLIDGAAPPATGADPVPVVAPPPGG